MKLLEKCMGSLLILGVTVSVWLHPASTYSWAWQEAKSTGHEFITGVLDLQGSRFDDNWNVISGGNQSVDLSRMIPGDARRLDVTLANGASTIDFDYKICAVLSAIDADEQHLAMVNKLESVMMVRVEHWDKVVYDGTLSGLKPMAPGDTPVANPTEDTFHVGDAQREYRITVYLPQTGVGEGYQGAAANLTIRFLAKQHTPDAIYAE
ncbi:UNVERIFIED_CONTAM: hypothetical protein ABID98_000612 [Brevibacillus sp. OAP136]